MGDVRVGVGGWGLGVGGWGLGVGRVDGGIFFCGVMDLAAYRGEGLLSVLFERGEAGDLGEVPGALGLTFVDGGAEPGVEDFTGDRV